MDKLAVTDYPIHELIARRWSPRALDPRPIPPATIRSLLEAARWSASSYNEQPWTFIVARHEDREEFERLLSCLVEFNRTWAKRAGFLMLTVARLSFARTGKPNSCAVHDVGLAAATLTLQATACGLMVHQMAGILPDEARRIYSIPEGFEARTAIAVGHPGRAEDLPDDLQKTEGEPRTRKPQDQFVFAGGWGQPASW